jgi:hypothetical protein
MEASTNLLEPLLQKTEQYCKTSIDLLKLRAIDKSSDIGSTLFSRLVLIMALTVCTISLNIAIALWLGDVLGKNYYGFIIIAIFYGLAAIVLLIAHPKLKAFTSNLIVAKLLK